MQAFRSYLKEHIDREGSTLPATVGSSDAVDLHDQSVREGLNFDLSDITDSPEAIHPVSVYKKVGDVLSEVGYSIPDATANMELFSEDDGDEVLALVPPHQSLSINEPVVTPCYLYFAFCKDDSGYYDVLAEVVNEVELEEILSNAEPEAV